MNVGAARASSHRFLEHTGEVRLRVRAVGLKELFAEAARGLARLLGRRRPRGPVGDWVPVQVRAGDRTSLLVDWLNELIFVAESARLVPTEVQIVSLGETELEAKVRGVRVAEPPSLVKAATLHGARVDEVEGGFESDIVFDI